MRLILKENSFQFSGKHYLQRHGIAMGTKMAVAFAVIFMAHIERQLLAASPFKPTLWKRFIDDIFSVWTISEQEINDFVSFANNFHPTIKFTCEMSSERIFFLDTEVFKGPRFAISKTLDVQTHFKRQCRLRPSEIENMWHMMKNQNSPFFAQRYLMVALETWWHFLLRNYF